MLACLRHASSSKAHLRLSLALFFSFRRLPVHLAILSVSPLRLPIPLQLQRGPQTPSLSSSSSPSCFCTQADHTWHLHRDHRAEEGGGFHPSVARLALQRASHPLIPAPLSLKNGRGGGGYRAAVVSGGGSVSSSARTESATGDTCPRASFLGVFRFKTFLHFGRVIGLKGANVRDEEHEDASVRARTLTR